MITEFGRRVIESGSRDLTLVSAVSEQLGLRADFGCRAHVSRETTERS